MRPFHIKNERGQRFRFTLSVGTTWAGTALTILIRYPLRLSGGQSQTDGVPVYSAYRCSIMLPIRTTKRVSLFNYPLGHFFIARYSRFFATFSPPTVRWTVYGGTTSCEISSQPACRRNHMSQTRCTIHLPNRSAC